MFAALRYLYTLNSITICFGRTLLYGLKNKQEVHVATSRALVELDSCESKLLSVLPILNAPSQDELTGVEEKIERIRTQLGGIRRDVPSIRSRKDDVLRQFDRIQARVEELRHLYPNQPRRGPIVHDSSESIKISVRVWTDLWKVITTICLLTAHT